MRLIKERQALRADYCKAGVAAIVFEGWVGKIPNLEVRGEFERRFKEWDLKISKGTISKADKPEMSLKELMGKVEKFYATHVQFLQGNAFRDRKKISATPS